MKFWELTSAFQEEKEMLHQIFSNPKWKRYQATYQNLDVIVREQHRAILDEEIPDELALQVCSRSNKTFWFYATRDPKLLSGFQWNIAAPVEVLTATDVFNRFGGQMLEEINEKAYTEII